MMKPIQMASSLLILLMVVASLSEARSRHLVVSRSSEEDDDQNNSSEEVGSTQAKTKAVDPIISEFRVTSHIQMRYAVSLVEMYVKNPGKQAKEVTFSMVLPDSAFISNFSMTLKGVEHVARVEEKVKAKQTYDEAVKSESAAGLVETDTRNVNQVIISVNVEAQDKARFKLVYEELLERRLSRYSHAVHVNLAQVVPDFRIDVFINESLPVIQVRVPEFTTNPNEVSQTLEQNSHAVISKDEQDPNKVHIVFKPDEETQRQIMLSQSKKGDQQPKEQGLRGQFVVEYDVDRKNQSHEVQLLDGYFVHYFAPDHLATLSKHVIFVLDISGSMHGEKLQQTKDAMVTILDNLHVQDRFTIFTFSDDTSLWKLSGELDSPRATKENIEKALEFVLALKTAGGTNINDAMIKTLELIEESKRTDKSPYMKRLVIFLTDGEPTTGVTDRSEIQKNIETKNSVLKTQIFGLAFGRGADFDLIRSISDESGAFARRIYEGSDAAIQLEDFYLALADPVLNNVHFKYLGAQVNQSTLTKTNFQTFFRGGEYVVAGELDPASSPDDDSSIEIVQLAEGNQDESEKRLRICFLRHQEDSTTANHHVDFVDELPRPFPKPVAPGCHFPIIISKPKPVVRSTNFIERLWAFLTIKQLLKEDQKSAVVKEAERQPDLAVPLTLAVDNSSSSSEEDDEETITTARPAASTETAKPSDISKAESTLPLKPKDKALALALDYNFVTPITSLVVTRNTSDADRNVILEPFVPKPVSPRGTLRFSSYSANFLKFSPRHGQSGKIQHVFSPSSLLAASGSIAEYDSESEEDSTTPKLQQVFTSSRPPITNCDDTNITLYSQTYLRGESASFHQDTSQLPNDFGAKVTSLEVQGSCCWTLFSGENLSGESISFAKGQYKSASDLKSLFRKVGSLQKQPC